MKKSLLFTGLLLFQVFCAFSQGNSGMKELRFTSRYTSFPDSIRAKGYTYDSVFYPAADHYQDSSVLLIVPATFHPKDKIDLIFWFHGWHNNIDTANQFYEIEKQFVASGRNAVLVLAETAKNAPDSYGGKLEQNGVFSWLVGDVLQQLKKKNIVNKNTTTKSITLAGHSGAYRVIAQILANGQVPVDKVFLFDALYSQTDKFLSWIQQSEKHHFVNWYTDHGGTDQVSIQMMQQLGQLQVPFRLVEEAAINSSDVKSNRILFVHSPRPHNVIINHPDNLLLLLQDN